MDFDSGRLHDMKSIVSILALTALTASALVIPRDRGEWPEDWPKELERLREQARTTEWATGSQEDSHRIPFGTRGEFEKYWPVFQRMLKPGARITLRSPEAEASAVQDLTAASVVIQAPPAGVALDGEKTFRTGFAWPESAYLPDGTLPEYVIEKTDDGKKTWVPLVMAEDRAGFQFRARIDLTLVCDGEIIDLNRIRFPKGVAVVDARAGLPE